MFRDDLGRGSLELGCVNGEKAAGQGLLAQSAAEMGGDDDRLVPVAAQVTFDQKIGNRADLMHGRVIAYTHERFRYARGAAFEVGEGLLADRDECIALILEVYLFIGEESLKRADDRAVEGSGQAFVRGHDHDGGLFDLPRCEKRRQHDAFDAGQGGQKVQR